MLRMKRHHVIGIIASLSVLLLYFLIMILFNPLNMALLQFSSMWYWILLLSLGFGIQVGLFAFIRQQNKINSGTLIVSGTTSIGSMIACCVHHVSDIAPILGLSVVAIFFSKYQVPFILLGLFSNMIGILMMFRIIKNCGIKTNSKSINNINKYNIDFLIKVIALLGIISIILSIGFIINGGF